MHFSTKKMWPFHTKYIAKIRISKFSAKIYVCPDKTLKKDCHWPDVQRPHFTRIPKEMQELIQIPCKYLADPGKTKGKFVTAWLLRLFLNRTQYDIHYACLYNIP